MEFNQFDRFTVHLSTRLSRRRTLAGGLAGLGTASWAFAPGPAEDATPEAQVTEHPAFLFVQAPGRPVPNPMKTGSIC